MNDMTFLWLLAALAIVMMVETVRALFHDGQPIRPPRSHTVDPTFLPPATRSSYDKAA